MRINGVENPCMICGKAIPTGKVKYLTCQELGFIHGKKCNCQIEIGSGCYRKFKRKAIKNEKPI